MEVTIKQLENLFDSRLEPIDTKLGAIAETQSSHTNTLDFLVKQTQDWNAEMTVLRNRMERYENALKVVADKLHIDLRSLLN
jgi:hypothetical protein